MKDFSKFKKNKQLHVIILLSFLVISCIIHIALYKRKPTSISIAYHKHIQASSLVLTNMLPLFDSLQTTIKDNKWSYRLFNDSGLKKDSLKHIYYNDSLQTTKIQIKNSDSCFIKYHFLNKKIKQRILTRNLDFENKLNRILVSDSI